MDDEAIIRTVAVVVVGVVALIAVLVFGTGWAEERGAAVTEARAQQTVLVDALSKCHELATAQRSACITAVVEVSERQEALNVCINSGYISHCVAAALGGTTVAAAKHKTASLHAAKKSAHG